MTQRFDWRAAFSETGMDSTDEQRRAVRNAIQMWNSDWAWDTHEDYLIRVEDEDGDGIWDEDYDDSHDVDNYFSSDFIAYMDNKFLGKAKPKRPTVIGNATKLPLPGSRP